MTSQQNTRPMITPKDQDELRALDALVEEQVFGWRVDWDAGRRKHGPGFLSWDGKSHNTWRSVPSYSAAPHDAMLVLKKIIEKDDCAVIYAGPDGGYVMCSDNIHDVFGATLPITIARFARQLFTQTADKLEGK